MRSVSAPRYDAATVAKALGVGTVDFLGDGTFGDTWRAGDRAVKIICVDGYPPERVAREVDGLMRVSSSHVVRLFEAGQVVLGGRPRPALHFEYVDGGDLQGRLEAGQRPTPQQTEALLRGLLTGVRDLHSADGTVHRDIKPSNVALRGGMWEQPVLLDLGLARSSTEQTVTIYPSLVGTTMFMAPEQLRQERARKAADLFAVGVTVRALLSGRHPFYDDGVDLTFDEALQKIQAGPFPLPADLPQHVTTVLDLLVSYTPNQRGSATSNLRRLEANPA
ncbi:protein kinase (plasmid) [Kineococcus radiotolerans SRS30216 = ATCC BAA-149]|uniref:Protein kinase n=1 Tax=Kineococcus radiotolerans (strain ATCC BAA-149 / DSM 14245 / SRS30216) TaxID=266940 RepID=A6WGP1_KINRD|nr:protein kinase [Kineococcus radiotolerans SRS30216 = ATCC BAA-149]